MPVSKPTEVPRWATDGAALITEPSSGKKDIGWIEEPVPADWWNWIWNRTYLWILWLQDITNQALTWTTSHIWNVSTPSAPGIHIIQAGDASGLRSDTTGTVSSNAALKGVSTAAAAGVIAENVSGGKALDVIGPAAVSTTLAVAGVTTTSGGQVVPTGTSIDMQGTANIKFASNPTYNNATANIFNNKLHASNTPKSWANVTYDHLLGGIINEGYNIDSVILGDDGLGGTDFEQATVYFKQPMSSVNYVADLPTTQSPSFSNEHHKAVIIRRTAAHFTFRVVVTVENGVSDHSTNANFTTYDGTLEFSVFGKQ